MGRRKRVSLSLAKNLEFAEYFLRFMEKNEIWPSTRTDLRKVFKSNFLPKVDSVLETRKPTFGEVMYCFRSKHMKVIQWTEANDRENIVYLKGPNKEPPSTNASSTNESSRLNDLKELFALKENRLRFTKNRNGVIVKPEADNDGIVFMKDVSKKLQLIVVNQKGREIIIQCSVLGECGPFKVDDKYHIVSELKKAKLSNNERIHFSVTLSDSTAPGLYNLPIMFIFINEDDTKFHIIKYVRAVIADDVVTRLQPKSLYQPNAVSMHGTYMEIERGQPPNFDSPVCTNYLPQFTVPDLLKELKNKKALWNLFDHLSPVHISSYAHRTKFSQLLHVEEIQMERDIKQFQMEEAELVKEHQYLSLEVPGLAENRPSLVRGDRLSVRKLRVDDKTYEAKAYEGYVHDVELNKVKLKFSNNFHNYFIQNASYLVDFKISRSCLRLMHRAIHEVGPYLDMIRFNGAPHGSNDGKPSQFNCFDRKIEKNDKQKQAVQHILEGCSKPYPYLVFGPPGTGKTVTIVEAIKQVLRNNRGSIILACAPSNSAADLILERVAKHQVIPKKEMIRINAYGRNPSSMKKDLMEQFCHPGVALIDGYFKFPNKETIEQYRFVVTTLMSAGRLVSLGVPKGHFTHIFIDEAGQGMEPECLIPIAGLLDSVNPGQVVLAGDPKQLGPVVRSPVSIKYGLGVSFLERLMAPEFTCFNRQNETKEYNPKVVTKLLNNYRSHPAILKLPNEMFYDNELRACADELQRNRLCSWEGLVKQGFPVIFHAVCGKDLREEKSPSFFNAEEVSMVLKYVKKLKEHKQLKRSEIGIISPYHRQVQKIRQELQRKPVNIRDIKVGSVEEFQGQERTVIIISTVRSSDEFLQFDAQHKLGFLRNPKRFNVAITRAKALLIVIGNPHVLCYDDHWRRYIQYCIENESFTGDYSSNGKSFVMPQQTDEKLNEMFEKLSLNKSSFLQHEEGMNATDYEEMPWRPDDQ